MSAQLAPPSTPEKDNVVELADGPGRRLRQARQARGLHLEQIATGLHLHPKQIAALERDDYQALPGPVFIVGYIRNYARLLGQEPQPLIDAYRAAHPEDQPPPAVRRAGPTPTGGGHRWVRLASLAVLAALGVLAFNWWQGQQAYAPPPDYAGEEATADVAVATPPDPVPVPDDRGAPTADEALAATPAVGTPEPAPVAEPIPEPQPQPQPTVEIAEEAPAPETAAPAAATEPEPAAEQAPEAAESAATPEGEGTGAAAQPGEVVMSFTGPCWVDIRDSERKFKIFGEMSQGDRRVLEGKPPYSVILGNAAVVNITVAGAPYDLSGVSRGNVARFTLDPGKTP
jgi:cytoskeleton protein RodZ